MSAYTLDYTYTAPSALIDGADSRALSLATSGGSTPEGAAQLPRRSPTRRRPRRHQHRRRPALRIVQRLLRSVCAP